MAAEYKFDTIVKGVTKLRNRVFSGRFPEGADLWDKLLSSEMANFLPVGIAMLDRDFVLLKCNEEYKHYIDSYSSCSSKDALGLNYFELFASSRSSLAKILKNVRDNEAQYTDKQVPVHLDRRKTDQKTYWDAKVVPVKNRHQKTTGIIITTSDVTRLIAVQDQVRIKETEINELKSALRAVIKLRQEDLAVQEQKVLTNVKLIVEPFINHLKSKHLPIEIQRSIDGIEFGIDRLTSDFSHFLKNREVALTPKEIQVAAMIRMGKTSKDIAGCFNVSTASIDFHRKNIRSKLNLKNRKVNLQTYLMSFFD